MLSACTHSRLDGNGRLRSGDDACLACRLNLNEPDPDRHWISLTRAEAGQFLSSTVAASFAPCGREIVGLVWRRGLEGQGLLEPGERFGLHGTDTSAKQESICTTGLRASNTPGAWMGWGAYVSSYFGLSGLKYNNSWMRVILCTAFKSEFPYISDQDPRLHGDRADVDARVPGGVASLPMHPSGNRYTSIEMSNGGWVNGRRRQGQVALAPIDEDGNVAARVDLLIFFEDNSAGSHFYGPKFTAEEKDDHPSKAEKARRGIPGRGTKRAHALLTGMLNAFDD